MLRRSSRNSAFEELGAKPELRLVNTGRRDTVKVQRQTNNILLRTAMKPKG
jgi:hypothetical protein